MARVTPPADADVHPDARGELDRQLATHGRVTNMKRTLARSPAALAALMQWYPLRDAAAAFLGDRATTLFAHAVSTQADCLICSTFFRRILADAGDDPDHPYLNPNEAAVVAYGRAIAKDANGVPDPVFEAVEAFLTADQIVALTAFAGLMLATNVFNNALQVDLDEYLYAYRRPTPPPRKGSPR